MDPDTSPSDRLDRLDRRRVLALSGVSLAALAGCAGGDEAGDPTDSDEEDEEQETADESDDTDGTADEPEPVEDLRISIDTADAGGVGIRHDYAVGVENPTDTGIVVDIDVSVEWTDGTEELLWDVNEAQIPAGDEWMSDEAWVYSASSGTIEFEVDVEATSTDTEVSETRTVEIGTGEVDWGESVHVASDQVITFGEPELRDEYEYEGFGGETETHTAPPGEQFVFIYLEVANESDEQRRTPNRLSFELATADTQTEPMRRTNYERDDAYDGRNEVLDGVVEDGILPYQIPSDADRDELRLIHEWREPESNFGWEILVGDD